MYCLKCGSNTQDNRVFCDVCLDGMQDYPIKPGTVVQIPTRPVFEEEKKQPVKRRGNAPADQVRRLRITIRWLWATIIILLLVLGLTAVLLVYTLDNASVSGYLEYSYNAIASNFLF